MAAQTIVNRGTINLLLLALSAGLLTLVWLSPDPELPPAGVIPLTSLHPDGITRIQIDNGRQPAFQIERREDGWWLTAPHQGAADQQRVSALLKLLTTPSLERFSLPEDQRQAFGLSPPRPSISFDGLRLTLGGTHPYNHRRYLLIGRTLHLIKDVFPHHFLAGAEDFMLPPVTRGGA